MLLQTNSYLVPKDKRSEHARLLRRFRQTLARLGCDSFDVYEQVGSNWTLNQTSGRFVQIMRFRDRRHQQAVQQAEQADPIARQQIAEFCELVNIPYQQQQGLFAVSYYTALLPVAAPRGEEEQPGAPDAPTASQKGSNGQPGAEEPDRSNIGNEAHRVDQAPIVHEDPSGEVIDLPDDLLSPIVDTPAQEASSSDDTAARKSGEPGEYIG